MVLRPLLSLLIAAALAGCASMPTPGTAVAAIDASPDAEDSHQNLNATLWMQHSAEFEAAVRGSFRLATRQLEAALQDPSWDALPRDERAALATPDLAALPPAIIVDADETMIDNTAFQARGIRDNAGYTVARWEQWVGERRARALPGAVEFARRAAALGVTVYYVTNRDHLTDLQPTADNLRALGFPIAADNGNLMLMNDPRAAGHDKGERRRWIGTRHRVVLMLGDNLGDFLDGVRTGNRQRRQMIEPYSSWWGDRWIMLPNPSYGSWEGAIRQACPPDQGARSCLHSALRYD